MVGNVGFEPTALWSQTRCATRLRQFPFILVETEGIEPSSAPCKSASFPLAYVPVISYGSLQLSVPNSLGFVPPHGRLVGSSTTGAFGSTGTGSTVGSDVQAESVSTAKIGNTNFIYYLLDYNNNTS